MRVTISVELSIDDGLIDTISTYHRGMTRSRALQAELQEKIDGMRPAEAVRSIMAMGRCTRIDGSVDVLTFGMRAPWGLPSQAGG